MKNHIEYDTESSQFICQGEWDLKNFTRIETSLKALTLPDSKDFIINGEAITKMDSAGAMLLENWRNELKEKDISTRLKNFSPDRQKLFSLIEEKHLEKVKLPKKSLSPWIVRLGKGSIGSLSRFIGYLSFIGMLTLETLRLLGQPKHLRWSSLANVIDTSGIRALGIIALLSFMIGIVLAYQMGIQLRNYGANVFIVNLLGLSVLREFGPLLTAIMIAGRTGSSFTAQLGIMKINQEIDALNTMGVTPAELLLLPRIFGLVIALPLLTMWADIFGIAGGMIMANNMLGIGWHDFLHRFQQEIPLKSLIIGLGKAPVFALIIASIGCHQGMTVENTADSLGKNTTRSVVLGIFFIIVVDAIFSIIFSRLRI